MKDKDVLEFCPGCGKEMITLEMGHTWSLALENGKVWTCKPGGRSISPEEFWKSTENKDS